MKRRPVVSVLAGAVLVAMAGAALAGGGGAGGRGPSMSGPAQNQPQRMDQDRERYRDPAAQRDTAKAKAYGEATGRGSTEQDRQRSMDRERDGEHDMDRTRDRERDMDRSRDRTDDGRNNGKQDSGKRWWWPFGD